MEAEMIKKYYTANELSDLRIPMLPKTRQSIKIVADKQGWDSRKKMDLGGGKEYSFSSFPDDVKNYLLSTQLGADSAVIAAEKNLLVQNQAIMIDELKPYQRAVIDARSIILAEIDNMANVLGGTNAAIDKFKRLVDDGLVAEDMKSTLIRANAKSGKLLKISRATIFNWKKAVKDAGTTTALAQKEIKEADWPIWGDALLKLWQRPQKPTLFACMEELATSFPFADKLPSYSAAQRFLKKLPAQIFNKGRIGSRELKKYKAYVSRDTSKLWPTAVYTADGHTFDAEVVHPLTGKPFRPEITTVVDIYTRKVVGYSIDLSERTNSVYMALASSIVSHGIPSIWYVDNGKGFNNHCFDDNMVGLLARLGIEKRNSIAYNSQARGIGERIHQSIWVRASKNLGTYMGVDMDAEAKQKSFKKTRKDIKNIGGSQELLSWDDFKQYCSQCVKYYNDRPHRSLPERIDASVYPPKRYHLSPSQFWDEEVIKGVEIDKLSPSEIKDLYRYYEVRKTSRGLVQLFNNSYFSMALEPYHGKDVAVAYDVLNASKVWVRELTEYEGESRAGRLICEAIFEGNSVDYFPISKMQLQARKRTEGRIKRLQSHVDDAAAELKGTYIEYRQTDIEDIASKPIIIHEMGEKTIRPDNKKTIDNRPVFESDTQFAKWLLNNKEKITIQDTDSLSAMLKRPETRMLFEMEDLSLLDLKELTKKTA